MHMHTHGRHMSLEEETTERRGPLCQTKVSMATHSNCLTDNECLYAQIKTEALATILACKKFTDYVLGKKILIETDHKL